MEAESRCRALLEQPLPCDAVVSPLSYVEGIALPSSCCTDIRDVAVEPGYRACLKESHGATPIAFNGKVSSYEGLIRLQKPAEDGGGVKVGAIDALGYVVIPFEWGWIEPFCGGRARACRDCTVRKDGQQVAVEGDDWVWIDKHGKVKAKAHHHQTNASPSKSSSSQPAADL